MTGLQTAFLGMALFCYLLYRQCIRRPVTRQDLLLPAIGALYLAWRYLGDASITGAAIVFTTALIGIGTGFLSGRLIRVWRDEESGHIYQFGGWPYAVAFVALLVLRVLMRVVVDGSGLIASAAVLNDAFIGMLVGNYLGRAASVGLRALALVGWNYDALPHKRDFRRAARRNGMQ